MNIAPSIAIKNQSGEQEFGGSKLTLEIDHGHQHGANFDGHGGQFRSALSQRIKSNSARSPENGIVGAPRSVAESFADRAGNLASNMQKDQMSVSRQLEQATRTGDSVQLVKAMMALNDYQVRVQVVSKTISKGFSAFDQLTKLQ